MKRRRLRYGRIFILIVIIIIIFGSVYLMNGKRFKEIFSNTLNKETTVSEFSNSITFDDDYNSSDFINVESTIIDFLNLYYKSIYYLEVNDFDPFFSSESEYHLFSKALEYQIEMRKNAGNNLKLENAYYDLEFVSIKEKGNNYEVVINEDSSVNFRFMKDITTKYYNIESTFVFDENYKLVSYRRNQDFYTLFTENLEYNFTVEEIDTLYYEIVNKSLLNTQIREDEYSYFLENPVYEKPVCDNKYDRNKALAYATEYITERNLDDWDKYDDYGGNCQNFASQVMYAGGIPMDTVGDQIWKYYGTTPSSDNTKNGRSPSWTIVSNFYTYAKNNMGYGLCSETDVNLYYAEPGDIMQIGKDNSFVHSVVVIGTIKKDDTVIDILVNSNSNDYENVPISSMSVPEIRLIKINGWNN